MIPPFVGQLMLMGTAATVALALIAGIVGLLSGQRRIVEISLAVSGLVVLVYTLGWGGTLLAARYRVLAPGEEVSFCGLDCHLHVSVAKVERTRGLGVTVRFRSDAKVALEYPSELWIGVVDRTGREYLPSDGVIAEPLRAGETMERELHFALPAEAAEPRLIVTWKGGIDYLVPGEGNPLVQRRSSLALVGPAKV
ncbi:MAG: hypothetical protein ABI647_11750 [Gemmatimonadota bacterium]